MSCKNEEFIPDLQVGVVHLCQSTELQLVNYVWRGQIYLSKEKHLSLAAMKLDFPTLKEMKSMNSHTNEFQNNFQLFNQLQN